MGYEMALQVNGQEMHIPVLPSKLEVSTSGKNEKTTVLELGEILQLRDKGLYTVEWDCFFPVNQAPYTGSAFAQPMTLVRALQAARDAKQPIRLILTGFDLDVNRQMGIESFDYEERAGEPGDLYYSIKLCEWKDYSPRRITLPKDSSKSAKAEQPKRIVVVNNSPQSHTVVAGDCLWNIAQKYYGDGSKYRQLYEKNKSTIDGWNRGTGNPLYTIYPGQVFTL